MNYRSVATLNRQLAGWVRDLPRDLDLIVGIPRSGLLVANLLALHLDLPLTDVDGLIDGRVIKSGRRRQSPSSRPQWKVLVVDDSLNSGGQLAETKRRLAEARLPHELKYAVVYVAPGAEQTLDYFHEVVEWPRLFEWNLVRHTVLLTSCIDIDGVLCEDPASQVNDDGPRYAEFLRTARPLLIPTKPVGWLVTCRLDRYRQLTEQWLERHGVNFRELLMMSYPDQASRVAAGSHSAYKAEAYRATGADLFIESSASQALEIAQLAGKRVLCMETREMISPMHAESGSIQTGFPIVRSEHRRAGPTTAGGNPLLEWSENLQQSVKELLDLIPAGATLVLADDAQWGVHSVFASRTVIPFLERGGHYWGPPDDSAKAIAELERLRRERGAQFFVLAWPSFWWLKQYPEFAANLRERFPCRVHNERIILFDLTCNSAAAAGRTEVSEALDI